MLSPLTYPAIFVKKTLNPYIRIIRSAREGHADRPSVRLPHTMTAKAGTAFGTFLTDGFIPVDLSTNHCN
jgi:hypothetical protein